MAKRTTAGEDLMAALKAARTVIRKTRQGARDGGSTCDIPYTELGKVLRQISAAISKANR